MGKQIVCIWDDEVAECFDTFGGWRVAAYFEALRYRQQLCRGEFFPIKFKEIYKKTGLSYYHQKKARTVLEGSGWLDVTKKATASNNCVMHFKLTELAYAATSKTPRPRNLAGFRRKFVNSFSRFHNSRRVLST